MTSVAEIDRRLDDAQFNQQRVLARFGEFALRSDDLDAILTEACRLVGEALDTHLAKVVEPQPGGAGLFVRAGVGWAPGVVGRLMPDPGKPTVERQVLETGEPVVSPDVANDVRFSFPSFFIENNVRALATVVILGAADRPPFGVLQVDSRVPRSFDESHVNFLRGYANLLAAAVERLRVVRELRGRAEEKERLLAELQHRVKNNLQTVMDLVSWRIRRVRDPEASRELRAIGDGIEALRLVHDKIYQTNDSLGGTDLGSYLAELTASVLRFHGEEVSARIRLTADVEAVGVGADVAIPLGLVTSEFVTNSLKYAFGNGTGAIGIRVVREDPDQVCVTLWDDGRGMPAETSRGSGVRLIAGLVGQLRGTATWEAGRGVRLVIRVPAPAVT